MEHLNFTAKLWIYFYSIKYCKKWLPIWYTEKRKYWWLVFSYLKAVTDSEFWFRKEKFQYPEIVNVCATQSEILILGFKISTIQ